MVGRVVVVVVVGSSREILVEMEVSRSSVAMVGDSVSDGSGLQGVKDDICGFSVQLKVCGI